MLALLLQVPCACLHAPDRAAPERPPLTLLHGMARYVEGKAVVDIRPTTDVAVCFLHSGAASVTAIYTAKNHTQCEGFEASVRRQRRNANFSVICSPTDYHAGVPDADVYVWWQRLPGWTVGGTLSLLRGFVASGRIRSSAHALIMFDLTSWRDAGDWQKRDMMSVWWFQAAFDERVQCSRLGLPPKYQSVCLATAGSSTGMKPTSGRACGRWAVGAFPLVSSDSGSSAARPHNETFACPFSLARLCVAGTIDGEEPACRPGSDGLGGGVVS